MLEPHRESLSALIFKRYGNGMSLKGNHVFSFRKLKLMWQ